MKRRGYLVVGAADGTEAVQRLESDDPPQLVVLDRMMPGLDGLGVCRAIRTNQFGQLLHMVDERLYRAKEQGRNQVEA